MTTKESHRSGRVVIVGASVAGVTAAESIRWEGFEGEITLLGDEAHSPYNRPPLSKQVLTGHWQSKDAHIADPGTLAARGISFLPRTRATSLDLTNRVVWANGREVSFDRLIVATGVSARRLRVPAGMAGIHVLRTLDDAIALRDDLLTNSRIAIIGAGVLGSEIASSARKLGLQVTLVGRQPWPTLGQIGTHIGSLLADLYRNNGVELRLGLEVSEILGNERVRGMVLSNGEVVNADVVVTATGSNPNTRWLHDSGLQIDDGIVCDPNGRATPEIYAIGDVSRWHSPLYGRAQRIEHQVNATDQARAVAHHLVHGVPGSPVVPFFWSEQFDKRIQAYGVFPRGGNLRVLMGDPCEHKFVAEFIHQGKVAGILGFNMARDFRLARALIDDQLSVGCNTQAGRNAALSHTP